MTVTERTLRDAASREFGTWLETGRHQPIRWPEEARSRDGGIWRGPTEAAWTTRLLRGALPPRPSTGNSTGYLVAHG